MKILLHIAAIAIGIVAARSADACPPADSNPCGFGLVCQPDGSCIPDPNDVFCTGDLVATQDSCGEASCSCASPCSDDTECQSLCCVDGYCALPCTCELGTSVLYNCGSPDESTDPPGGCGCVAAGAETRASAWALGLGALAVGWAVARRRSASPGR